MADKIKNIIVQLEKAVLKMNMTKSLKIIISILLALTAFQLLFNLFVNKSSPITNIRYIFEGAPSTVNVSPNLAENNITENKKIIYVDKTVHKQNLGSLRNLSRTQATGNLEPEADAKKKILVGDIFRSGFGRRTFLSENGQLAWLENGVIYRPIANTSRRDEKYPPPQLTNYETYVPFNQTLFFQGRSTTKDELIDYSTQKKIILWYTRSRYTQNMPAPQPLRLCPEFPCLVTTNKKYTRQSAMLVFNGQRVDHPPPTRTSPDQIYMFHNQEPPLPKFFRDKLFRKPIWSGNFNWTMSYRSDSDIPAYYGNVRRHPDPPKRDYKAVLAKKKRRVAWMVSHCGSPGKRDAYVRELKKYIDVDIYGRCGNGTFKCNRNEEEKCTKDIATTYKFYLAFENGICDDYITEKFFRFMPMDTVTIARATNQFDKHVTSGTFINTADFTSPQKLAEHLVYLDNNDKEYIKILNEKDKYIYLFEEFPIRVKGNSIKFIHYHYESVPFCQACLKLWNLDKNRNIIPDIGEWFDKKPCRAPQDLTF